MSLVNIVTLGFFNRIKSVRLARIRELETKILKLEEARDSLEDRNSAVRIEGEEKIAAAGRKYDDLVAKIRRDDDELAHMLKMKESKLQMEFERKSLALERDKFVEIATVRNEYRDKLEGHLKDRIGEIGKMYSEILTRLPNVDVALKGRVGQ